MKNKNTKYIDLRTDRERHFVLIQMKEWLRNNIDHKNYQEGIDFLENNNNLSIPQICEGIEKLTEEKIKFKNKWWEK